MIGRSVRALVSGMISVYTSHHRLNIPNTGCLRVPLPRFNFPVNHRFRFAQKKDSSTSISHPMTLRNFSIWFA